MEFNIGQFQKRIQSSSRNMYLIYGEEEYLAGEALEIIEKTFVSEATRDFNYDVFYAKDTPTSQILDVAETLPMMTPQRVVVVKNIDRWNESDWDLFAPYIDNPSESTLMVFIAKSLDKRKKNHKKLLEKSESVECKKPYDNQIPSWIHFIAQKMNVAMDADAISLLHQFVGSSLSDIQSEMQKLAQFVGDRNEIGVKDVMDVVSKIKVQSVFDLSRAIGENDKARALLCLSQLLSHGQSEVGILTLVARHVRILRSVKKAQKDGVRGSQLASQVGVSPYFLAEYESQARDWNEKKIERTFKALLDTDRALKSSPLSSHIWLENFVIQTCI
jgi:DNA polymerase III subunit delta